MTTRAARNQIYRWLLALLVFVVCCTLGFFWIDQTERLERDQRKAIALDLASDHAQSLQRGIERALSATYAIAAMVRQANGKLNGFDAIATEMLQYYPGISVLSLSPNGVICCVVPKTGNEKSIGFNVLGDSAQGREARLARDTGLLTLAGPINLTQGGQGVVGRLPIFLQDVQGNKVFWGFSHVALRFPQALDTARLAVLQGRGFAYELWRIIPDTGEHQRIASSSDVALRDPVSTTLELPNGKWTLSVEPVHGWGHSPYLSTKWIAVVLVSLLLAYLAFLLIGMRQRDLQLEEQVAERTAEILATQQHLEATIDAIPDPLFELGLDGRYFSSHSPRQELLARPVDELKGRTVSEVMPPDAAQTVIQALQEANDKTWSTGMQIVLPLDIGDRWFELSVARKNVEPGMEPRFVVLSRDITEKKQAEEKVRQLAHFDVLTGLPNRALLADRCSHALSAAQRSGQALALMFVDLDHFKNVNDSLGHRVGDDLLNSLAQRLIHAVRHQDTVARLGGDEFVLILPDTDISGAARVAEKIRMAAIEPFEISERELVVTSSIGIAMYPQDGKNFDDLSRCADSAMYDAKQRGRNQYRFFTAEIQARSQRTLVLENALRRALERNQLYLHYQPLLEIGSGAILGAEALLRWNHPELGLISPAEFIPIAESSGLILPIGEWVLRAAVQQLSAWLHAGISPISMAVNVSTAQFRQSELTQMVGTILKEAKLPPHLLVLELTEGASMHDPITAIATMDQLNKLGVRLAIDDFGTGYSSLNYLKKFNVSKVKIDQSFVRDIAEDPDDRAIVSAIISMAKSLGIRTIAEGVETPEQLAYLRTQGCNEVQGYYFSKPVPPDEFFELFSK